jgi:hypothetical protein
MLKLIFNLMILAWISNRIEASHFFGGTMSAVVVADFNKYVEVQFTIHFAYKRVGTSLKAWRTWCNDTTIHEQHLIGVSDSIYCEDGCLSQWETVGTTEIYCQGYSEEENWTYGVNTFVYLAKKTDNYQVFYYSCCWGPLGAFGVGSTGFGNWELRLIQNLLNRTDTGKINTTPISLTAPFVTLPQDIVYTMKIPYVDVDGDVVRCELCLLIMNKFFFLSICFFLI